MWKHPWVRIPLSPPHFFQMYPVFGMQKYPSGRRGSPAKGVGRETVARVQIPPSAPNPEVFTGKDFGIFYSRKSLALILGGPYPPAKTPYSIASAIWRRRVTDQPKLICEFCVKFIIEGLHFPQRAYILKLSIKERRLVQYGMVQQHRRFRRGRPHLWQRRPGDLQRAVKGPEAETTPIGVGFLFL